MGFLGPIFPEETEFRVLGRNLAGELVEVFAWGTEDQVNIAEDMKKKGWTEVEVKR